MKIIYASTWYQIYYSDGFNFWHWHVLISIFDNFVSNQEICHFVPLWYHCISPVLHFLSSWLLTYFRGISLGIVWAIFLWNWLRLNISLSIRCHFVLMLFFNHFLSILPSMTLVSKWSETSFLPNRTLWATIHACVLEHLIKRRIFTFEKWILFSLVAMATK